MHNGPQIQDNGRENATSTPNNRGRSGDSCYCGKTSKSLRGLRKHKTKCPTYQKKALAVGDIIKCQLCDYTSAKLTIHIKSEHQLTKKFYLENYGDLVSPCSKKRYSAVAKENGDWINRAKAGGEDLSEHKAKLSKSISEAIMNNPEERLRRSELLGELNRRQDFRDRASETAKITSARPDIIASRSAQLKRWRDNNPEEFYEKCTSKAHAVNFSIPEKTLYNFILNEYGDDFKHNKQVNSKLYFFTNKIARKQVDILDKNNKIILEFDGKVHFDPIFGNNNLSKVQAKDKELDNFCLDKNYLLIRVSQSCFIYKTINDFDELVKVKIKEILKDNLPGVYYLGKEYGDKNIMELI